MTSNFKLLTTFLFSLSMLVSGETLTVGPSGQWLKPCQAFAAAASGDTILIDAAGDYRADYCAIKPSNLLIRGVNGRPRIDAMGGNALGKAIWVVQGNDVIIENVEMLNCKVPDRNGAAIRGEGENLTLRWVYFHHNQNGLLMSQFPGDVLIEFSEFAFNGYGDGYTHNIYVGHQQNFTLRFSYIHHSFIGNGVKSRAGQTNLYYNRIMTEQSGTGSLEIDVPNGGKAVIVGNLVQQGALSVNNAMVSFATEGGGPVNELRMAHNTVVSQASPSRIFSVPSNFTSSGSYAGLVVNNIFQGGPVVAQSYVTAVIPFQNNLEGDGWLADLNTYDYRLLTGSPAINAAVATPADLVPRWQYIHPACGAPRTAAGAADQGAYEANAVKTTASGHCTVSWDELTPRFTLPSSSAAKTATLNARVTLDGLAPAGGVIVQLSSSKPDVAPVPATVTVPAGESTVVVPIDVVVGAVAANVVFTAELGPRSTTSALSLSAGTAGVASVTLGSASVAPGGVVAARVTLSSPAPAGGAVVTLTSSNTAAATVPSTVTVPAGAVASPNFNVTAAASSTPATVTLTAAYASTAKSASLTVTASALASFAASPLTVTGGSPATATITLNSPAPAGGAKVLLTSSNAAAQPPTSITVAAGSTVSPALSIPTSSVASATQAIITAAYGGVSKSVTLSVTPASTRLYALSLSAAPITGGRALVGVVLLVGPAPAAGAVVKLTSANPAVVTVPATVTVPGGATKSASFNVSTGAVSALMAVPVTASFGGVSKSVTVQVKPAVLSTVVASGVPISGGKAITSAYVAIDGPAPAAGAAVRLTSSHPTVAAPPSTVIIPKGATVSAYFNVSTSSVSVPTAVVLTATYGGVSKSVTVNVKPTALWTLVAANPSVSSGRAISGYLAIDGPAPAAGAVVTLTSSNPAVAMPPRTITVAPGATASAYFTISTGAVSASTQVVITATYGGVSKSVTVTVTPATVSMLRAPAAPPPAV